MDRSKESQKKLKYLKLVSCVIVIFWGTMVMLIPVIDSLSPGGNPSNTSFSWFAVGVLFALFLPTLIYCMISVKTRHLEYVIFPGIGLIFAEYYFFHDYTIWIASDANAAIALIVIPFYLLLALAVSYAISYLIIQFRIKDLR